MNLCWKNNLNFLTSEIIRNRSGDTFILLLFFCFSWRCNPRAASLIAVFMSITANALWFRGKKKSGISVNNQHISLPISQTNRTVLFLLSPNNKLIFSVVFQHLMSSCSHFPLISAILFPLLLSSKIFSRRLYQE